MSLESTPAAVIEMISVNDILNSAEYFSHLETENRKAFILDYTALKKNLISWVAKGYPDEYTVFTFPVTGLMENGLYKCSDSTNRGLEDYVPFFLQTSLSELIAGYQAKVGGIKLGYAIGVNSVNLIASKPSV